jgi:hypothetical protein
VPKSSTTILERAGWGPSRLYLFLLFLTGLAVLSRLYGINSWTLEGDEYFTVAFAEERSRGFVGVAYYWLVTQSTALFGDTLWAARIPSALMGILSVPLFFAASKKLLGEQAAVIGSVLIVLSEWHLYHSQLSRFYSGVFLFAILSYFAYYHALKRDSVWWLGGALLANAVGVAFHATSILVPAACGAFSLFVLWGPTGRKAGFSRRIASLHLGIVVFLGLIALPRFLGIATTWSGQGSPTGAVRPLLDFADSADVVLLVAAAFGVLLMLRKRTTDGAFLALGIGVPLLTMIVAAAILPNVRAKYIFYTLPLLIAAAGYLAHEVKNVLSPYPVARHVITVVVVVALIPGFISYYTGHESLDVREPVAYVQEQYQPGDRVAVFAPSVHYALGDRFPEEAWVVIGGKGAWTKPLRELRSSARRSWVLIDTYRDPVMPPDLEAWLMQHGSLVWRERQKRFDYAYRGYEVWVLNGG